MSMNNINVNKKLDKKKKDMNIPAATPLSDLISPTSDSKPSKKNKKKVVAETQDKSHLEAIYGHSPQYYQRDQLIHIIQSYIDLSKSDPAHPLNTKPEAFSSASDPENVVIRTTPISYHQINDPLPV
jgi:hypothetical protein